ncbi:MarR family protein [Microbacterium hydrocarbonoxydans]|uniref:MarR family protein n=1 Tax=Microbacterium hydrocarbonoxydans TaxID=273678 RepID=A0A0M2HRA3_9MICO|nr:MarR family protein [Microbacterium hydrocarbonoxydans]
MDDEALADLADAVLVLGREIEARHPRTGFVDVAVNERLVLRSLDRDGEATPSALAERLGLQRSNLSTALRGLEAKGLIVREHDGSDGRAVIVRSTALAAHNLALLRERWSEVLRSALPDGADVREAVDLVGALADGLVAARTLAPPRPLHD